MANFLDKLKKNMGAKNDEKGTITQGKPSATQSDSKTIKIKKLEIETGLLEKSPRKEEVEKKKEDISQDKIKEELLLKAVGEKTKKIWEKEKKTEPEKEKPLLQKIKWQALGAAKGKLAVDVYQTNGEIIIRSAIAGIKPEDLDISVEPDRVLIAGERTESAEKEEKNYFYQECYWGKFFREIILPEETDPEKTRAEMKNGILTIRLPKTGKEKKKKIQVKS